MADLANIAAATAAGYTEIVLDKVDAAPRSWVEQAYPKLIHYNQLEKGGHFAAWQVPELFVPEVRTGLRSLR